MRWARLVLLAGSVATATLLAVALERSIAQEQVVPITARQFAFDPPEVTLVRGVPVVLEFTSLDRVHGFRVQELGIRTDVLPGQSVRVRVTPDQVGRFVFICDVFCGADHDDMAGEIVVVDR